MVYNPFKQKIGELTKQDLERLCETQAVEGYYLQYSLEFPAGEILGRSIASFANTYGGWLIAGIRSENHVANALEGFGLESVPDPLGRLREILDNEVDPVPICFPQLIRLEQDRAVLAVFVPENQETPFISKDGRIYRRTHDASEPVPEINRYSIDRLFDNGKEVIRQFERFCGEDKFPRTEDDRGAVKIFLSPYPAGMIEKLDLVSVDSLTRLLDTTQAKIPIPFSGSLVLIGGYLPFQFGQNTECSVILRQSDPASDPGMALMCELFDDGRASFYIPLNYFPFLSDWDLNQVKTVDTRAALGKYLSKKGRDPAPLRFFDIAHLWLTVACLVSYYQDWIGNDLMSAELLFAIEIKSAPRSVPFFDSSEWGAYVQARGMPVIDSQQLRIPHETGRGGGSRIRLSNDWPLWLEISYFLSLAFGLPPELYSNTLLNALEQAARQDPIREDQKISAGTFK